MASSDFSSPRDDAAAAPEGLLPVSFAGQARDFTGPMERLPAVFPVLPPEAPSIGAEPAPDPPEPPAAASIPDARRPGLPASARGGREARSPTRPVSVTTKSLPQPPAQNKNTPGMTPRQTDSRDAGSLDPGPAGQPASRSAPGVQPSPSPSPSPDLETETDEPESGPSTLPADTAISLQQLTAALMRPAMPASAPPSPRPETDSLLSSLADQLTDHLSRPEAREDGAPDLFGSTPATDTAGGWDQLDEAGAGAESPMDLMDGPLETGTGWSGMDFGNLTAAPAGTEPPVPDSKPIPVLPPLPEVLPGPQPKRIALTPPKSPPRPAAAARVIPGPLSNPPRPAPPSRQGDVFFVEAPTAGPEDPEADLLDGPEDLLDSPPLPTAAKLPLPPPKRPILLPGRIPQAAVPAPAAPSEAAPPSPLAPADRPERTEPVPVSPLHALPPALPRPAAFTAPAAFPDHAAPDAAAAESRGVGLIVGGSGLILLGIYLACRLPLLWLDLQGADSWTRQKTESALILQSGGALLALWLGTGSVLLRRWAPPLILAAGWLGVFTAALFIGVSALFLGGEGETALTGTGLTKLLAGLLIPLLYLFYYEKETPAAVCAAADRSPSWTDAQTIPGLMVFLSGLAVLLAAAAMLPHQPSLPLPHGEILTGPPARLAWAGFLVAGLFIVILVLRHQRAANWLLFLVVLALAGTIGVCGCADRPEWQDFLITLGRAAAALPSHPAIPLLAGLSPALPLLVLAMSRRAFASPPPP